MEREMLKVFKFRSLLLKTKGAPVRFCYNLPQRSSPKGIEKPEDQEPGGIIRPASFPDLRVQYWNEASAMRKQKRKLKFSQSVNNVTDLLAHLQSWNNFPVTLVELMHYFKRRWIRTELVKQAYLPERVAVLKPDLAAAHFLVGRGGLVQFVGSKEWIGFDGDKKTLPVAYIPGMFIESIKAERTDLIFEGLANLNNLKYLKSLSLRNLNGMNDWCMDYISKEHYKNLKHLDISGCKNITYRGLSCFYRFECLETLNVEGISDTPDFKLACLMLLEVMPNLEITGINLDIPEKIEPPTAVPEIKAGTKAITAA